MREEMEHAVPIKVRGRNGTNTQSNSKRFLQVGLNGNNIAISIVLRCDEAIKRFAKYRLPFFVVSATRHVVYQASQKKCEKHFMA
jgi:hypothetical protein